MKKLLLVLLLSICIQFNAIAQDDTTSDNKTQSNIIEETKVSNDNFSKDEVVTYKSFKISNIDKMSKGKSDFNIFTPLYGESTNTDTKGFEAVIVNNKVIKLNQYNSYIPKNGYVVSGHGKAKKFITKNIFEGAEVEIDFDKNEFKVITHPDDYIYEATYRLKKVKDILNNSKEDEVDKESMEFYINRSDEILDKTKKFVQFGDYEKALEMAKDSMVYSDRALYYSLAFNKDEFKGVWVTPQRMTKEEIAQAFDSIQHMYVDNIFIEVFFNGSTIYKSDVAKEYGLAEQNSDYKDIDVLAEWIKLGQLYDKNIYVSFNTFNLGRPKQSTIDKNIVKVHPEWLINKDAKKGEDYIINPENAQAQAFLFDMIREVFYKYKVDGMNVKGLYVKDKDVAVSNFVNKLISQNTSKNLLISVEPEDINISDWKLNENITLLPVLTSSDTTFSREFLSKIKNNTNVVNIYPVYMESYLEELPRKFFDQVAVSRELGINGIVIYDLSCMTKEFYKALRFCIFKEPPTKKDTSLFGLEGN